MFEHATVTVLQASAWIQHVPLGSAITALVAVILSHTVSTFGKTVNYARGASDRELHNKRDALITTAAGLAFLTGILTGILSWLWLGYAIAGWAGVALALPFALVASVFGPVTLVMDVIPLEHGEKEPLPPEDDVPAWVQEERQQRTEKHTESSEGDVDDTPDAGGPVSPDPVEVSPDGAITPDPDSVGNTPDVSTGGSDGESQDSDDSASSSGLFGAVSGSGSRGDHI